jgi:hypothetical protein
MQRERHEAFNYQDLREREARPHKTDPRRTDLHVYKISLMYQYVTLDEKLRRALQTNDVAQGGPTFFFRRIKRFPAGPSGQAPGTTFEN